MEKFKLHEDAIELTEKYSAYQLAKMLLEAQEEVSKLDKHNRALDKMIFGDA